MKKHKKRHPWSVAPGGRSVSRRVRRHRAARIENRPFGYIEPLEARRVLDANSLVFIESTIAEVDDTVEVHLGIDGNGTTPTYVALLMTTTSGDLDPAELVVQEGNRVIRPELSLGDAGGTVGSLFLAQLDEGEYRVFAEGENGTTGNFRIDVFVPGDLDDGTVSTHEYNTASAAEAQQFEMNPVAQLFFRRLGINVLVDQYDEAYDANMNGKVDAFDMDVIEYNHNKSPITATLIDDTDDPVITVELVEDTGIDEVPDSFSDGLTSYTGEVDNNDDGEADEFLPIFTGTVTDTNEVASLQAGLLASGIPLGEPVDIAFTPIDNGTDHSYSFELTLEDLNGLFGIEGGIKDVGPLTLQLIATDEFSNESNAGDPFEFDVELDTIAPPPPTELTLTSADQNEIIAGREYGTTDTTPEFDVMVESGAWVYLLTGVSDEQIVDAEPIEGATTVALVSDELENGTYEFSTRSVDLAGNQSTSSSSLTVTIDTVAITLAFQIDPNLDPPPIGPDNNQVSQTTIDLVGTTKPGATVELTRLDDLDFSMSQVADSNGEFTFTVELGVGTINFFTATATDAADNSDSESLAVYQNTAPEVGTPISVDPVNEDAETMSISLVDLFTDLELGEGTEHLTLTAESSDPAIVAAETVDQFADDITGDTLELDFQPDVSGVVTITVTATDQGGLTATFQFDVTVNTVNDAPEFDLPAEPDIEVLEGAAGVQTVSGFASNISPGGGADEESQVLTFDVEVLPSGIIQNVAINPVTGDLTYELLDGDVNGEVTVLVALSDDGGTDNGGIDTSALVDFTITVLPVNDAPTFTLGGDQEVLEDSGLHTVEDFATNLSVGGGSDESTQTLTGFTVNADSPSLFSVGPAIDLGGTLTYTLADNAFGTTTVTVTLSDDGGTDNGGQNSTTEMFTITVEDVNDPPVPVDDVDLQVTIGRTNTLNVLANDDPDSNEIETLQIIDVSSATNGTIFISPDGLFLLYTPGSELPEGTTDTFTYTIEDSRGLQSTTSATVTVVFTTNSVTAEDDTFGDDGTLILEGDVLVELDVLDNDVDDQGDDFSIVSNSQGSQGGLIGNDGDRIFYTPPENFFGEETFTYTIEDEFGAMDTATVTVVVTPVNDAPSFELTAQPDQELLEGTTDLQTVIGIAGDTSVGGGPLEESSGQSLTGYAVTTNHDAMFAVLPSIDLATGNLTYQLADGDVNGLATVSVRLVDDGGTDNGGHDTSDPQTFTINVTPVNDAPSFSLPANPDQTIVDDGGTVVVSGFATNISPGGGADEATQTLTFLPTPDVSGIVQSVSIDPATGDLTIVPVVGAEGTTTIAVQLMDNGGTDNGGIDTSPTQTFDITVVAENDPPVLDNPIPDMLLNDVDPGNPPNPGPQPDPIDLTTVFSDPDSDLAFEVVSNSNPELVSATVNGDDLIINYLPFDSQQDRTPAEITVRATEVGGTGQSVTDTFLVSVAPQTTFELYVVVRESPTDPLPPTFDFQFDELPTSISEVSVGQTYVVEIYMRDLLVPNLIAGTDFSEVISGGFVDITYDADLVSDITLDDLFDTGPYTQDDANPPNLDTDGLIEQFGGLAAATASDLGLSPHYVRLGYLEVTATSTGTQQFNLSLDDFGSAITTARVGRDGALDNIAGDVHPSQVEIHNASVEQVPGTIMLTIDPGQSTVELGGTFSGEDLEAQQTGVSDTVQLSGTITIEVDDLNDPSTLQIINANISWGNTGDWTPTDGSENGSGIPNFGTDPAAFGLFVADLLDGNPFYLAGRDLISGIESDLIQLGAGGTFDAAEWDWTMIAGEFDQHLGENTETTVGGADDFVDGVPLTPNSTPQASLVVDNGTLTLTLPVAHHLDMPARAGASTTSPDGLITGSSGDDLHMVVTGQSGGGIVATFSLTALAMAASQAPSQSPALMQDESSAASAATTTLAAAMTTEATGTTSTYARTTQVGAEDLLQEGVAIYPPDPLPATDSASDPEDDGLDNYFDELGGGGQDETASFDGDQANEDDLSVLDAALADGFDLIS